MNDPGDDNQIPANAVDDAVRKMQSETPPRTKTAIAQMVKFLQETKGLTQTQAYQAASMAADLHITELVDGNVGVHMMIAKAYLKP